MGKRELVLIALFVAVGIVVYQVTAPAPPPGSEVSVGGIFQRMKRQMQGARESATAESRQTLAVDPDVRLIRINFPRTNDLSVVGGDRPDITAEIRVTARGYDQPAAKATAEGTTIKLERAGDAIAATSIWPSTRRGGESFVSQVAITLHVPRRLSVRLEPHSGELEIRDLANVEIMGSRGRTRLANVGQVVMTQSSGNLEIDGAASLKLTARNSPGEIKRVAGAVTMDLTNAELKLGEVPGPLDVEARNSELALDAAKLAKPPFRYNGTNGQLKVEGLKTEARIDGRNVDITVNLSGSAPVTIYTTSEDMIVTAPPGGYALDAVATEGRLVIDDGGLSVSGETEQRVSGAVRGGGPPLTLRASRADIRLRKPEGR